MDVLSLLHSLSLSLRPQSVPLSLAGMHSCTQFVVMASGALTLFGLAPAGPPSAAAGPPREGGSAFCLLLWACGSSQPPKSIQTWL